MTESPTNSVHVAGGLCGSERGWALFGVSREEKHFALAQIEAKVIEHGTACNGSMH